MITATGCSSSKPVILQPIYGTDLIDVNKGETITAPVDGYFVSNEYFLKTLKVQTK
jgi:hypothetical protein